MIRKAYQRLQTTLTYLSSIYRIYKNPNKQAKRDLVMAIIVIGNSLVKNIMTFLF